MSKYQEVTICGDVMFVNRIPFLVTISRHLKFGTVEMLRKTNNATIVKAIEQVKQVYNMRGFKVETMLADGQFETTRGNIADMGIVLNTASPEEHVPEVERQIRTLKEKARSVVNVLPFKKIPPRMLIELIYYSNFWNNAFPNKNGVSETISPRTIVTGQEINYEQHCKLEFGEYVQVHEESDNTMASRTTGAISLRPTGNNQGGYFFYSLSTGKRLNRNHWTDIPMPNEVIDRVNRMADEANADEELTFEYRDVRPAGVDVDDEMSDDDETYYDEDPRSDDEEDYQYERINTCEEEDNR